jgi:hypothetical protein
VSHGLVNDRLLVNDGLVDDGLVDDGLVDDGLVDDRLVDGLLVNDRDGVVLLLPAQGCDLGGQLGDGRQHLVALLGETRTFVFDDLESVFEPLHAGLGLVQVLVRLGKGLGEEFLTGLSHELTALVFLPCAPFFPRIGLGCAHGVHLGHHRSQDRGQARPAKNK